MHHLFQWSIGLMVSGAMLIPEIQAAPPSGRGSRGGNSSWGIGVGVGGSPGSGVRIGVGNGPYRNDYGYYNRGYYDRDYYNRGYYGGWYGGSGLYFGGGSHDFRWGIGIPFGYDDYDWYAPYYNRYYYNYGQAYYPGSDYYDTNNAPIAAQSQQVMEQPPVPTAGQVARLTDEQLRMMIAVALDSYSKDLDGFTTGEGWKKHFKLAELKTRLAAPQTGPADAASRALFTDVSQKFQAAGKDPTYEVITKSWSFQTLQVALKEYSLTAELRQAHVLNAKAQTLKKSLDGISTGAGWKAYLEIDDLEKLLGQNSDNNPELNKKLEKILERFDDVIQNPQYKIIAELQGFDVTRSALQQYIHSLESETAKQDVSTQPLESGSGKASL